MGHSKHLLIRGREEYVSGLVKELSDVIVSTMGPGGDIALIQTGSGTMATKDGVTVSRHIAPRDSFSSMISRLIIDAANRTVKEVGDGTTTTVCLLSALYSLWVHNYREQFFDKRQFLIGMDEAVKDVLSLMKEGGRSVYNRDGICKNTLCHVARIACNGDNTTADMISDLVYSVGANGRVMIKKNIGSVTYTERESGYTFDTVLLGRQHLRDRTKGETVLINPLFMLSADVFEDDVDIVPVIDAWLRSSELKDENGAIRPLVIVTTGLTGAARSFISANADQAPVYVVSPPLGGEEGWEVMTDIQDLTATHQVYLKAGGKPVRDAFGADFEPEDEMELPQPWKEFGSASKCILSPTKCSIIPDKEYSSDSRVALIQARIAKSQSEREIEFLQQRIAALLGGVGVVYVGADSDAEADKLEHAIDDGQRACFTALKGGVVAGAGRSMWFASVHLSNVGNVALNCSDEDHVEASYWNGYNLVLQALAIPACQIIANYLGCAKFEAGQKLEELEHDEDLMSSRWRGWEANGRLVDDMFDAGIIDPYLVCQSAIKNASSVAKQLIHCKYVLIEDKGDEGFIGAPGEQVDERINTDDVRELYKRLDLLKANKEGNAWHG